MSSKKTLKGGMPTGMPINSLIYTGGNKKTKKGGIPTGIPINSLIYRGGNGLVEQYFKEHNFPFRSHAMGVNIIGHPIVTSLKQDENKAYTTILNKGGTKSKTKKKDSKTKDSKDKKKSSKTKSKKK